MKRAPVIPPTNVSPKPSPFTRITRGLDRAYRAAEAVVRSQGDVSIEICSHMSTYLASGDLSDFLEADPEVRFLIDIEGDPQPHDLLVRLSHAATDMAKHQSLTSASRRLAQRLELEGDER